jgi:hypothetical protein
MISGAVTDSTNSEAFVPSWPNGMASAEDVTWLSCMVSAVVVTWLSSKASAVVVTWLSNMASAVDTTGRTSWELASEGQDIAAS